MKVPAWVYIVGIAMIVFGGCGTINNFSSAVLTSSDMMKGFEEINKQSMENMDEEEREVLESLGMGDGFLSEEMMTISKQQSMMAIPVSLLFLISGIILLLKKKQALKIAYITIVLSFIVSIIGMIRITSIDNAMMGGIAAGGYGFSMLIDLVLLLILIFADKTQWKYLTGEYEAPEDQAHAYEN